MICADRAFQFEITKDAELARAELTESDDEAYQSNDIVLASPRAVGDHVYRAVVVMADKDGALHEQASTEVRFVVKPHAALLNVWGLPSAIVAGERFSFSVGVKCSAGCDLSGRGLSIVGRDGSEVGAAQARPRHLAGHRRAVFYRG